jgi:hypothetical protein
MIVIIIDIVRTVETNKLSFPVGDGEGGAWGRGKGRRGIDIIVEIVYPFHDFFVMVKGADPWTGATGRGEIRP